MENDEHDAVCGCPVGEGVIDRLQDFPTLKGALHTHTSCSDGELKPQELLEVYHRLGFDFVALTDHDFLLQPAAYDDVPDEFEKVLVFKGVEKTVFARGYFHVTEIHGDREMLNIFDHPADYNLPVDRIIERIQEIQAIMPLHAVEVTSKGFYTAEFDIEQIPYPKVASDDCHTREGCGRAWIEVACEKDRDAILRAIKTGGARACLSSSAHPRAWMKNGEAICG
jgi:hypothetical protein